MTNGRSALVAGVGAYNGLGAAIARRFAAEGYVVCIAGRNGEKLADTAARIRETGAQVISIVGDVSEATDAERFIAEAARAGRLDAIIHNAGSNRPSPFLDLEQADFETHWREHTLGGFQIAKHALPLLLSNGGGTLAFTGASGSLRGKANYAPFAVAKAGLRALAQSLAREFSPKGVHVAHVVIDGGIDGDRLLSRAPDLRSSAGPMVCLTSTRLPTHSGICIPSNGAPGRSSLTYVPGPKPSDRACKLPHESAVKSKVFPICQSWTDMIG
ncbi:SDR family NAD(P)-dependent oxidoreductase [Rhizobium sp. BE258]|uniref:SDR family NAD(P)-dependent oxidoreductase n=1 Tax=Rhizobium sp. BE258 TaxID=2817722 RepID=UPI0028563B6A|nr:SDR family NAD(P)-dependent oxidoreductase [Rhizobium sp. BE258]MDR7145005.1 NAD(P)-dependent dehydrogenase (short-subunit alcohol dehydrogenase family) [Rhizobium sp. BE258]